jgi:hypothetical protein
MQTAIQQVEILTQLVGRPWAQSQRTLIWDVTRPITEQAAQNEPTQAEAERATLAVYLVYAPWMHDQWAWHYVGLVHLRPIPGAPPAYLEMPDATHELVAAAIDPRQPLLEGGRFTLHFLHPPDITQQFTASRDAEALLTVEQALRECVAGRLSLDQDFRRSWTTILRHGCTAVPRRAMHS